MNKLLRCGGWPRRAGNAARLPQAGRRLDRTQLAGIVDVRARVSDPQSVVGWFRERGVSQVESLDGTFEDVFFKLPREVRADAVTRT